AENDIARVPMTVDTAEAPVEEFTIRVNSEPSASSVDPSASSVDRLGMHWGKFRWSVAMTELKR
ncbi:MAG TPA: hypothetical protein VF151_01155, partial [Gemmatimonadales bacterium]